MDISPQSHELNPHHSATMGALVPALSLPKGASQLGTSEAWNLNRVSLVPRIFRCLITAPHRIRRGLIPTVPSTPVAYCRKLSDNWLAFAHIVIAIAFIGPLINPVRNKWVLQFGVIACAGVIPLALIAGPIRGIPPYWRLIDCSFGILGVIPLLICLRHVHYIERSRAPYN